MEQRFDEILNSWDSSDFELFGGESDNRDWKLMESELLTLDLTKLDKDQGQFFADVTESDIDSFVNNEEDFPPIKNRQQATLAILDSTKELDKNLGLFPADLAGRNINMNLFANHDEDFPPINNGQQATPILDPTKKLDKNLRLFSGHLAGSDMDSFANHDIDFPPVNNGKQATYKSSNQLRKGVPYTYDKAGQLEWNAGFEKEVIEHYLCEHHFYVERSNLKNCGLTLWIQRCPPFNDSYGPTPALCLYKDCLVGQNRHIQPGDIRIAFDEKTARGLERDPRVNAGYVHLKCLESHVPYHRQMFSNLNFKVEDRGPHKNDSWQNNPTIFTTLSQIVYAQEYLEGCSKEIWNGSITSDATFLSVGIEKQLRAEHPLVREVISKFIEMEGWRDLKALVDKRYAQALNIRLTGSKIESPLQPKSKPKGANRTGQETYRKRKKDHGGRNGKWAAKKVNRRTGRRNRYDYTQIKESRIKSSGHHSKKYTKKRESSLEDIELKVATKPQPLKKGEGKIKTRLYIKDGKEIWEDYEDLWSPLVSDMEETTEEEDDDEWSGDEDASGDDDEALNGDESSRRKRMLSDDEDDTENDEPRGCKRKR